MDAIQRNHFKTAASFLNALRVGKAPWRHQRHLWAFRGHATDRWKLIPTALRDNPKPHLGYSNSPKIGVQSAIKDQIQAEFESLHEFMLIADAQGLSVPVTSSFLRTPQAWHAASQKINSSGWPSDDVLALSALAQHYGIPTRLLDWTDNPCIAAYFAAKDAGNEAAKLPHAENNLAVWGIDLDWIMHRAWPGRLAYSMGIPVYIVTAPRSSNPNLHAQSGIFTAHMLGPQKIHLTEDLTVHRVDELVEDAWPKHRRPMSVMCHYTLPSSEAGCLLRLLYQEKINAATVFPGYKGVSDSLKERQLWDRQERSTFWTND